jgi:hypothetical protein
MMAMTLKERRHLHASKSDPAIPIIRDGQAVQHKFLEGILTQLREQNDLLRRIAEKKC